MKIDLLNRIIQLDGFIDEKPTEVDGDNVYIRPLYIEYLALFPDIQNELVDEVCEQISRYKPQVLYAIEASILPLAALVANKLSIPLSIIRKPRNYKHESDEPGWFLNDELKEKPSVLLDDAIWSGYTINHVFRLFEKQHIQLPQCCFIFDFLNFSNGGRFLSEQDLEHLKGRTILASYEEIIEIAYMNGTITSEAYYKTKQLFCDTLITFPNQGNISL